MKSIVRDITNFLVEDDGVSMVEYGLIAALIAVVCITAITAIGTNLNAVFNEIKDKLVA